MKKVLMLLSVFLPGKLRIYFLNCLGHEISSKAILAPFSILLVKKMLIDENAKIDSFSFIVGLKTLTLKQASGISRFTYISGGGTIHLNNRSLIGSRCVINTGSGDVIFGEYSVLAPRSSIYTHGTFLPVTHGYSGKNKGVQIGSYTWIMQNSSIGPGVKIGSNIIVLPGSTIVKGIQDNMVVFDTPVERKTFPIALFKKELSVDDLEKLIKEITISYLKHLIEEKKIIDFEAKENEILVLTKKGDNLLINLLSNSNIDKIDIKRGLNHCFFGHNLDKNLLMNNKTYILDFLNIQKSLCNPPKVIKDIEAYMFYEFGLKFIQK